jgi:hypothetical protein
MEAVNEPHAAAVGVGNMATQWLEERAATRALAEEMAIESGADVDEWGSRLRSCTPTARMSRNWRLP